MRGIPIDSIYHGDKIAVSTADETVIGDFERLDVYHGLRVLCLARVTDGRPELREIPLAEITSVHRQRRAKPRDARSVAQGNRILCQIMRGDVKVVR